MKHRKLLTQTLLALLCMLVYTAYTLRFPTDTEHRFTNWLSDITPVLTRARQKNNPEITFLLKSNLSKFQGEWKLHVPQKSSNKRLLDKALRLLELSRESEIFAHASENNPSQSIRFEIHSGEQHFFTIIPEHEVQSNISVQTLLQLFTVYSEPVKNASTKNQKLKEDQI